MKYDADTPLGLDWAGYVEVRRAYDWDPGAYLAGVPGSAVRGVEAPLWTETIDDLGGHGVHGVPAAAGGRGAGVVAGVDARLGRVSGRGSPRRGRGGRRWGSDFYRSPQVRRGRRRG